MGAPRWRIRMRDGERKEREVTMARNSRTESGPIQALRKVALRYPEAQEGTSCGKSAFKARDKAFLFVGMDDDSYNVMVKLRESLAEAARLETKEPGTYSVGGHGWVKATFRHDESPPAGLLERWIDESYRLLVHKQLVALLPERGLPAGDSAKTAKKKAPKEKSAKRAASR